MGKNLKGKELGEGLRQRTDGKYEARFTNRFGKRVSIYAGTLKEVKEALRAQQVKEYSKTSIKQNMTVEEWYLRWLDTYKKCTLRQDSILNYKNVWRKSIQPFIGHLKLSDVSKSVVMNCINEAQKVGYSWERQNKIRVMLSDMFDRAIEDDLLQKNPCKGIKIYGKKSLESEYLTKEEQEEFFDACSGTFYENAFRVQVNTGLRPGELFGLKPEDIDFSQMVIHVRRTLVYQQYEDDDCKTFHEEEPKTKQSKRDVPINSICEKYLRRQLKQKMVVSNKRTAKAQTSYLFTTKYNTPINSQIYSDAIHKIIIEMNSMRPYEDQLKMFSGHCFRHTFATRCFEAGIEAKTVQTYLGHASIKMTLDLYTHVTQDKCKDSIELICEANNLFESVDFVF